jgi:hypothetical protein
MAASAGCPWPIDRVLIVPHQPATPPCCSTNISEDRNRTSIFQRLNSTGFARQGQSQSAETWMRAGVGYAFHGDLTKLAEENMKRYMPDLGA